MEDSAGILKVRVIKGSNLAVRDRYWKKSSDPYVVVKLGEQKEQTSVIKKNLNPTWDEELVLTIQLSNDHLLELEVFDKDTFTKDDKMGNGQVDLKDLASAVRMRKTNPSLSMPKNKENESSSCIKCVDGHMVKEVSLRLQNVESGQLEVHIKWVDLTDGEPSTSETSPTGEDVIALLKSVADTDNVDVLINAINALLKSTANGEKKVTSHKRATKNIVKDIVEKAGNMHWMVGGLSIIAYFLMKIDEVSQNHNECRQQFKNMLDLTHQIKKLIVEIPEEEKKLKDDIHTIVNECIECATQYNSKFSSRYWNSNMNSEMLRNVKGHIDHLYRDLHLSVIIAMKHEQRVGNVLLFLNPHPSTKNELQLIPSTGSNDVAEYNNR